MLTVRAILLAAVCLVTLLAVAPAADARPPGGDCDVKEEYVTQAHTSGSVTDGTFAVEPGAHRPIECYY
ncbi:MAG TPA: hypothetical protein VJ874_06100 [Candidatus Thermoplasmatota archaeon]|nr:hypothetical protein [Candidatus Thermoplasmatota archaeon]